MTYCTKHQGDGTFGEEPFECEKCLRETTTHFSPHETR